MGKGDKKSRRGKIYRGTFGKRRPRLRNVKSTAAKPVAKAKAK
jgi:30S ribosomal protein S31